MRPIGLHDVLGKLLLCTMLFFTFASEAYAYIDPGSGALIWQMLIAGFIGSMFYFRRILHWFKRKETRDFKGPKTGNPGDEYRS